MSGMDEDSCAGYKYEDIEKMAIEVLKHSPVRPSIGIICGTGLGGLATAVDNSTSIPYHLIPGFPTCTVKGHTGKFVIGTMGGKPVLVMVGRFHFYEGYPLWKVTMPVRLMKAIGIQTLLVTNAAGGMNQSYKVGDVMIIKDHIDLPGLTGMNVLRGPNDERFGPRFLSTNSIYDPALGQKFKTVASNMGLADDVKEGVYLYSTGPTFLSLTESRLIHMFGADAIGMSTVPETIVAKHSGLRVFAFSLITDIETQDESERVELSHEDVLKAGDERSAVLQEVMQKFVAAI